MGQREMVPWDWLSAVLHAALVTELSAEMYCERNIQAQEQSLENEAQKSSISVP